MPPPGSFSHFPPSVHQSPHSFHPIDPRSTQDTSSPEFRPDTREGRSKWSTNDKKQSRSSSTPPDSRFIHDQNLQQRTGLSPVSTGVSRTWAQRGWIAGSVEVGVQVEGRSLIQVGGQHAAQLMAKLDPRRRRNSVAHPPAFTPGRTSISSPVDHPFIPGVATSNALIPNRLRKNSYQRPRILFYHRHEPHYGFTNFSAHSVMYEGRRYPTSEHLFQSFKFAHRPGLAEHIRTCSTRPSVAFSEARRFAQEVRPDWSRENINAMNFAIYHKFTQHKDLKRELLATGDAELIENSDKDAFWGCGADGKGRNELGKALERLRTQLREVERR